MFAGSEYQLLVDKINRLRSLGLSGVLSVPCIAIIGDQSCGKSSVLEATTKLSFPRDKGMCTRFATQVSLRHDPSLEDEVLMARIEGEDVFNARYRIVAPPMTFEGVINEAVKLLCRNSDISDKVLELTLSGPDLAPLTLVDLPGFINIALDGQDKHAPEIIRRVNMRYMRDPRTIILAVVPANVDLNNSYVLSEAEKVDPQGERTIPIVTKPDMIDPADLPDLIEMILNKRKRMRLGYLVMRNAGIAGLSFPWHEAHRAEQEFFQSNKLWSMVPDTVKGRISVQKFLGDLLRDHIKKELPLMLQEIHAEIAATDQDLEGLGQAINTTAAAKAKFFDMLMGLRMSLSGFLEGRYPPAYIHQLKNEDTAVPYGNKALLDRSFMRDGGGGGGPIGLLPIATAATVNLRFVSSSLQSLFKTYAKDMADKTRMPTVEEVAVQIERYKGQELPGFVSFAVFTQIFSETLIEWQRLTRDHIARMHLYLAMAISTYIIYAVPPLAQRLCLETFDRFYELQVKKIDTTLQEIFEDQATPFTLDLYYGNRVFDLQLKKVRLAITTIKRCLDKGMAAMATQVVKGILTDYLDNIDADEGDSENDADGDHEKGGDQGNESSSSGRGTNNSEKENGNDKGSANDSSDNGSEDDDSEDDMVQALESLTTLSLGQFQLRTKDSTTKHDQADARALRNKLQAYCEVARKRIVDVVLQQTVQRYMVRRIDEYFVMLFAVQDDAVSFLCESPEKQRQRERLHSKKELLQRSLEELRAASHAAASSHPSSLPAITGSRSSRSLISSSQSRASKAYEGQKKDQIQVIQEHIATIISQHKPAVLACFITLVFLTFSWL